MPTVDLGAGLGSLPCSGRQCLLGTPLPPSSCPHAVPGEEGSKLGSVLPHLRQGDGFQGNFGASSPHCLSLAASVEQKALTLGSQWPDVLGRGCGDRCSPRLTP